ncbi:TetR/AcrR family transcriptional regulator [Agrobacterium rosae]|uniref:HTH-type transcriptional regulator MtrR n=1 Tax=Agrobacterium rosae TaxID=1972867 RepID=A0A1R3U0A9_9HYPH|nr:TetR/AcrR family transcriptional regulator [Agrobacterium rosae]KAA3515364.1 TetR/AcrR family transcriptional regulator [Agrobacterium rosae]KAA3524331.1 TetR/AcrR family transcriptional regulator [Agrobacterium rosae]MBN7804383.1 TetR/AcrR family transcriptional regulator [Agrobacterium rosae]MCM2431226.1 TetR/AcrR family transcriptional regulator [Agrobacterium rosae]MDX8302187.1 TetR/AcrR family transcriptional regulator [Agrobacterium rosae]
MAADAENGKTKGVSTRERILEATLTLFNERSPDRVTTAEIARTVGINEGNLYYHFKTKEALLRALFEKLARDATAFMVDAGSNTITEPGIYSNFMRRWFSVVWAHRYIFRDLPGIIAIAPSLREPTRELSMRMRLVVEGTLLQMADARLIVVPEDEAPQLLANVWIVSTYWAVYLSLQEGIDDLGPEHLDWGLNQVASLFRPYLSEVAKTELNSMLGRSFTQTEVS